MKNFNTKGLVLTEVVLTIGLLAVAIAATASIIQTSQYSTVFSRNFLAAQNLANEGLEIVESLQASIKLKCPNNTGWLNSNVICIDQKISKGSYYVAVDGQGNFNLQAGSGLSGSNENSDKPYKLYLKNYEIAPNNSFQKFTSESGNGNTPSPFYREVKVEDIDEIKAEIRVKVLWKVGAKVEETNRSAILYNN